MLSRVAADFLGMKFAAGGYCFLPCMHLTRTHSRIYATIAPPAVRKNSVACSANEARFKGVLPFKFIHGFSPNDKCMSFGRVRHPSIGVFVGKKNAVPKDRCKSD